MPKRILSFVELLERLESVAVAPRMQASIGVRDPEVARYARVLEFGSIAGQRPWPSPGAHTTLAMDPETGAQIVVSMQAPQGFIRLQTPRFPALLADELATPANWLDGEAVRSHIADAVQRTAREALDRVRAAVPRDSGRLAKSIEVLST